MTNKNLKLVMLQDHEEVRDLAKKAIVDFGNGYNNIISILIKIESAKLWKSWGFSSINEYLESELFPLIIDKKKSYVYSLIKSVKTCIEIEATPEDFEGITPRKYQEIAGLITKSNKDELLSVARTGTYNDLRKKVNAEKIKNGEIVLNVNRTTPFVFQCYPDQRQQIEEALRLAGVIGNSPFQAQQLAYICLDFCSSHLGNSNNLSYIKSFLTRVEDGFGIKILAVDTKTKKVIHGEDIDKNI